MSVGYQPRTEYAPETILGFLFLQALALKYRRFPEKNQPCECASFPCKHTSGFQALQHSINIHGNSVASCQVGLGTSPKWTGCCLVSAVCPTALRLMRILSSASLTRTRDPADTRPRRQSGLRQDMRKSLPSHGCLMLIEPPTIALLRVGI